MKAVLFFLVIVPFLPSLLLAPDITYPDKRVKVSFGEVVVKNSVLPIKGEKNIRHQIDVTLRNATIHDGSCIVSAKYMKVSALNEELTPSVFKLWTPKEDRYAGQNQIILVTANYESSEVSTIAIDVGIFANPECDLEFDKDIQIPLTKRMRRWWPWKIVSDLIHSV